MSSPFFSMFTAFHQKKSTQFEPLIIHHYKPLKYHCFKGFCFVYFEYDFSGLSLKFQRFQGFSFWGNFYPTFVLQTYKPRQGIGPWSPMSNFRDFNALVFSVLSTLSTFCKKHYKSGLSEQLVRWCRLPPFFSENNDSDHPLKKHPSQGALPAIIMLFFTYLISTNLNL